MVKNGIEIIYCKDKNEASEKALKLLLEDVDQDTLFLLSGGTSPDLLYQLIGKGKSLKPGAVALIDERFGPPMHANSNEKMIYETHLLEYLKNAGIPFYGILKEGKIKEVAKQYDQTIRELFKKFPKIVAVMGIGADGHTAGIKPGLDYNHSLWVTAYDDKNKPFGKRITLTFEALNEINEFIILIFGEDKREAFESMFKQHSQVNWPAVFFTISLAKVIVLTDINLHS